MGAPAGAVAMRGGLSGSYYNYDDDVAAQDLSVTRFKLRLDVSDFMAYDSAFHLRTITRSVSGHDYNEKLPGQRIDQAEFEMKGLLGFADLHLGRMSVIDLPATRVDGVNMDFHLGQTFGLGLFGGQAPDPLTDQINGSYTTYGGYLFNRSQTGRLSLGYVTTAKGSADSTYVSGMYYSSSSSAFNWLADLRFDQDIKKSQWRLTEGMLSATYRPNRQVRINAAYNEYRAIRLFQSMQYDANYDLQRTLRLSADVYILTKSMLYLRLDGRSRDIDSGSASLVTGGFRRDNMFDFLFFDASYSSINYFKVSSTRANLRLGGDFKHDFQAEVEVTSINGAKDGQVNGMSQLVYGATVDWRIEGFFVSAMIQISNEKFLDVNAVYLNKAADHFASTSYYLSAGYNF
jgi:hypothetical protein